MAMIKPQPRITAVSKPYWDGSEEGRSALQRCLNHACHRAIFYPRVCCPYCQHAKLAWEQAAGTGRVIAHTTVYRTHHDGFNDEAPYVFAAVELTEGVLVYAQIPGAPVDAPSLAGHAVKADFLPHGPGRRMLVFRLDNA
jgi:uncharacterized OB-fold protein